MDQYFLKADKAKVVVDGGIVYASTLNQSNIDNNNNKFYILQVLEMD